jgi:hypothetical protein
VAILNWHFKLQWWWVFENDCKTIHLRRQQTHFIPETWFSPEEKGLLQSIVKQ